MQLSFMEIDTLVGYIGELLDSAETPDRDKYTLTLVYSKLVEYDTKKTLALTGATLANKGDVNAENNY